MIILVAPSSSTAPGFPPLKHMQRICKSSALPPRDPHAPIAYFSLLRVENLTSCQLKCGAPEDKEGTSASKEPPDLTLSLASPSSLQPPCSHDPAEVVSPVSVYKVSMTGPPPRSLPARVATHRKRELPSVREHGGHDDGDDELGCRTLPFLV